MTSFWNTLDVLPEKDELVIVAAWEFGCDPQYVLARYFRSSLPGQPPKFMFDVTVNYPRPVDIGLEPRLWARIPLIPMEQVIKLEQVKHASKA